MYKSNDYVIYRQLQVCKIQSLETPSFESDPDRLYYKLCPAFENQSNTTIYVPVDGEDSLRPLSTAEKARAALQALPTLHPTVFTAKKPPQLTAYYQGILNTLDVIQYLSLIKEVSIKEKNVKKLNEIDARYRAKTEKLLCEEFALVLGETPEKIQKQITSLL